MRPGPANLGDDAHALPADEVASALAVDPAAGLSAGEAQHRLVENGPNELVRRAPVPRWRRFVGQFSSPLVLLLLAAGVVSLVVHTLEGDGDVPYEALTIFAIVIANAILGFVQEERAEASAEKLKSLAAARALAVRGGEPVPVAAADLVPGDVIVVEEGDAIPADARVVESVSLKAAEAALTGESAAVDKDPAAVPRSSELADRADMLYAGTVVTYGHGRAIVTATGMRTEIGRIATMLASAPEAPTPLQRELARIGRVLGIAVVAIAIVVAATILAIQHEVSAASLSAILLYSVSLAVGGRPRGADRRDDDRALARHAAHGEAQRDRAQARRGRDARRDQRHLHRQDRDAHAATR